MNSTSQTSSQRISHSAPLHYLFGCVTAFVLLFILTFPLSLQFLPDTGTLLSSLTEAIVRWFAITMLNAPDGFHSPVLSDTTGLYIHLLILCILSAALSGLWMLVRRRELDLRKGLFWLGTIATYYLALQLFEYGFNKVFKWQFFLPEPNTLFTTLGAIPRDLLYWSTMGTSRSWTMFAGIMEVLGGILLVFRRTRSAGGLLALGIMTNVVIVNFSFDISVKVFSSFLLLMSLLVLAPDIPDMLRFFFGDRQSFRKGWRHDWSGKQGMKLYPGAKALIVAFLLFDVLTPYVRSSNFNDDAAPRPFLHGAYEVQEFVRNGDTLAPLYTLPSRWRRVFVHRRGYFIIQRMDGTMMDYSLDLDRTTSRLTVESPRTGDHWQFRYSTVHSALAGLEGRIEGDSVLITLKALNLKELPLLQNEFHWVIDGAQIQTPQGPNPEK